MAGFGQIGALSSRFIQLVSAAVVLGLSVVLANLFSEAKRDCQYSTEKKLCQSLLKRWPSSLEYSAFVGAFGLLDVLIGTVAVFLSAIPFLAVVAIDALAAIFYLAGGVNLAVLSDKLENCKGTNVCTRVYADVAFQFIGLVFTLFAVGLHFFAYRSSRSSVSRV